MASFAVGTRHGSSIGVMHPAPTHPRRIAWMKYDHLRLLLVICASVRGNGLSHPPSMASAPAERYSQVQHSCHLPALPAQQVQRSILSLATVLITGNSPVSIEAAKLMAAVGARVVTTARSRSVEPKRMPPA